MRCAAVCAFREPFQGGFVEAIYPGHVVEVPDALVVRLAADGHIELPKDWAPPESESEPEPEPELQPDPEPEPAPATTSRRRQK